MALPAHYATGTVTVPANGTVVSGVGTQWLAGGIRPGDVFSARGLSVSVASVESATSLTLSQPWPGAALAGAAYEVRYTPDASRVLAASLAALQAIENAGTGTGTTPVPSQIVDSLTALLASTDPVPVGSVVVTRAEDYAYRALTSATGAHITTAAPAYLRVLNKTGVYSARAFAIAGNGTADDSAKVQAAVNEADVCRLLFDKGDYRIGGVTVPTGCEIAAVNGSGEVTTNATGTPNTAVRFRYIGSGGVGSRIFRFRAPIANQWVKGGGIIGRPHLNGANICEIAIEGASLHGARFDVEVSRCTQAGIHLNGTNGVLSQFCDIDLKYVWGVDPALTGGSHGIVLNGNAPGTTAWVGCTQHRIWTHGLIHNGNMVHMVGHCDNNHLNLRASKGTGSGTGFTLAMYPGNGGKAPQVNNIYYASNDVYLSAESYGNVFHFITSESLRITGGGAWDPGKLVSYTDGKVYSGLTAPLTEIIYIPATEMHRTGAASLTMVGDTPVAILPKSGNGNLSFTRHNPIWGAGRVSQMGLVHRGPSGAAGNANVTFALTTAAQGTGLAGTTTFNQSVAQTSGPVARLDVPIVPTRAIAASGIVSGNIGRLPLSGGDTSTADMHVIGAVVRIDFDGPTDMETPMPAWREKL